MVSFPGGSIKIDTSSWALTLQKELTIKNDRISLIIF
jgi:hypothetical protein